MPAWTNDLCPRGVMASPLRLRDLFPLPHLRSSAAGLQRPPQGCAHSIIPLRSLRLRLPLVTPGGQHGYKLETLNTELSRGFDRFEMECYISFIGQYRK